jgi:hypothetical protein
MMISAAAMTATHVVVMELAAKIGALHEQFLIIA